MSERSAARGQFPGRLALQQRVLPTYRLPFFEALASACQGGLTVFAGQPSAGESITPVSPSETGVRTVSGGTEHRSETGVRNLSICFSTNRHWRTPSSPFYLCWQSHLLKWLAQEQPGALIVEANPRLRSTPAAIRWMQARGRAVLGWGLGAPAPGRGQAVADARLRRAYRIGRSLTACTDAAWRKGGWPRFLRQFDALIAYSPLGAEQYRLHGFPAERVFVAPNAVTPRPSAPQPNRPAALDRPPTVLFVGRLQARKRIDHLLRAAAALPTAVQPRLQVVGDGPARSELQALAQAIYPSAEFPGERTGPDLESYFAAADLFVLPGTGGLAVQQAMAHGLPVIAGQGDGTLDALIRPANGWRVPPSDLPALTQTLHAALTDIARLRRMGAESYRIVAEEVNLELMVTVFIEALNKCNG